MHSDRISLETSSAAKQKRRQQQQQMIKLSSLHIYNTHFHGWTLPVWNYENQMNREQQKKNNNQNRHNRFGMFSPCFWLKIYWIFRFLSVCFVHKPLGSFNVVWAMGINRNHGISVTSAINLISTLHIEMQNDFFSFGCCSLILFVFIANRIDSLCVFFFHPVCAE